MGRDKHALDLQYALALWARSGIIFKKVSSFSLVTPWAALLFVIVIIIIINYYLQLNRIFSCYSVNLHGINFFNVNRPHLRFCASGGMWLIQLVSFTPHSLPQAGLGEEIQNNHSSQNHYPNNNWHCNCHSQEAVGGFEIGALVVLSQKHIETWIQHCSLSVLLTLI